MTRFEPCSTCAHWRRRDNDPKKGDCRAHAPVMLAGESPMGRGRWPWTEHDDACREWEVAPDVEELPDLLVASKRLAQKLVQPVKGPGGKVLLHSCTLCGCNSPSPLTIEHAEGCVVPAFLVAALSCF